MKVVTTFMQAKPEHRLDFVRSTPFFLVHLAAVAGVFWLGWSWSGLALALGLYAVRMFGVTGVYHRYFSHRTYKTSRPFQLLLALLAMTSVQKGVLWWAAHHRHHHRMSDQPGDTHSVIQDGLWWSHVGWILAPQNADTDYSKIKDIAKYPELRFFDRYYYLPAVAYAVGLYLIGGMWALYWGFAVSTTLLWHGTFTINSLSHLFGSKRYVTTDDSRNNFWLALITLGEGWHNNHHYYQRATNQGFFWWEIDVTFYVLKALSWVGLVWDLHTPPPHVRDANRLADAAKPRVEKPAVAPSVLAPAPLAASSLSPP
jgi:stearoyl-CoA desaturase (Delta-9 desaturase)